MQSQGVFYLVNFLGSFNGELLDRWKTQIAYGTCKQCSFPLVLVALFNGVETDLEFRITSNIKSTSHEVLGEKNIYIYIVGIFQGT